MWAVTGDAFSTNVAYAVHWDGATWRIRGSLAPRWIFGYLYGLWGSGPSDIWAGGELGTFWHWDGSDWQRVTSPTERNIWAIWGTGPRDIWLGTEEGLFRGDGTTWTRVPEVAGAIVSIVGSSPTDAWVGTNSSIVYHWDGRAFTAQDTEAGATLVQLWSGGGHVWFVTETGGMLHRP